MSNTNMTELPSLYQQYIHRSRYARWMPEEKRRENWQETVARYITFFRSVLTEQPDLVNPLGENDLMILEEIEQSILHLEVMPSMRALMSAGPALDRDHIAGFNCSFVNIDDPRAFDEVLYVLMCGTGVGFSVERQHISKMPVIPEELHPTETEIVVRDSKMGWAKAFKQLIAMLYAGEIPQWDTSKVRPAGERLKVFGGRASGPQPLVDLFEFTIRLFKNAAGRKLTSIECHDILCKVGDIVVVGGVRRSALISLSNLSDQRMRDAKSGQWWASEPQRALANNSAAYTERPEVGQFMREWSSIYESHSGERGIFNREAAIKQCERIGRQTKVDPESEDSPHIAFGTNPCAEIILRSMEFCNLTEVVARPDDTPETLRQKVIIATILGTFQSSLTRYRYLRKQWSKNSQEERLLGVSITGIMDCPILNAGTGKARETKNALLRELRDLTREVNKEWADKLGIEPSAAITCVKPSGTVSQLVDASSGIHSRHSAHYIRTVRNDTKDPLTNFLISAGIPNEPCAHKGKDITVFSFPISAPKGAVCRQSRTAIDELEMWLDFKENWCHHSASVTVTVREDEWPTVGSWVWEHFDEISGISFLPYDGGIYKQAPYQETDKKVVKAAEKEMPVAIDWGLLIEEDDETVGAQELACSSGQCEI